MVSPKTLDASEPIVLYGAGRVGRDVHRVLTAAGIQVICFLDRRALPGEDMLGIPVLQPDACPLSVRDRAVVPVVLSMFNREVDAPAVTALLRRLGFEYVVPFVDLHAEFSAELGDRYWLTNRQYLEDHASEIHEAATLWADDASREAFDSLIAFRRSGTYRRALRPTERGVQYFPSDVPKWAERPLRFVDCGAFNGDTVAAIVALGRPIDALALFEPDPGNFAALQRFVSDHRSAIGAPVSFWPCAVSRARGTVNFHEGDGEGSRLATADGTTAVQAVALDDVLVGWRPSVIKMDIEGAELDALRGARGQIAASQPELAVCIYHRPGDLWQIPLELRGWTEMANYRYYLRIHGHEGFDAVLYARPDEVTRDRS